MWLSLFNKSLLARAVFLAALLAATVACAGASFPSQGNGSKKDWHELATSLDASGSRVYTKVFGYFASDNIFIVCDPDTGEELDRAYIGATIGNAPVFGTITEEDKSVVKRIDPVTARLFAPNVWGSLRRLDDNFDYFTAAGWSTWPGSTGFRLVPGSDPDYWLMVVEVFNPNPWPVKAAVSAYIRGWRSYIGDTTPEPVGIEKEVRLNGGDTKYVLLNRGATEEYFIDKWREGNTVWTNGRYETRVTENGDPELPSRLQPNLGYIDFIEYEGSAPQPKDLSGGIPENLKPQTGPYRNLVDAAGPALISYGAKGATWVGGARPTVSPDGDEVPVLKYYPIYVEVWRFKPDNSPDIGRLEKEVVPGVAVRASSIAKPRFELTSAFLGSSVENEKKSDRWVVKVNYHVTVSASNPGRSVSVGFSNVGLVAPNVQDALYEFERQLRKRTGISGLELSSPNLHSRRYNPSFVFYDTVTLGPGESKQLFDTDLVTEFKVSAWQVDDSGETVYIPKKDIEYALSKVIDKFNWSGEAAFSRSVRVSLTPDDNEYEKVLSLSNAMAYYRSGRSEYSKKIGIYSSPFNTRSSAVEWFEGVPFFNCDGVPMKNGDELWTILTGYGSLGGWIDEGNGLWSVWR